jgi:hypothetical protein
MIYHKNREKIPTMMCKTLYRKLYIEQQETTKIGSDLIVRGTVDNSCSISRKAKGKSQMENKITCSHPSPIGDLIRLWLTCLDILVFKFPKTFKLFGFPNIWL